MPKKIQFDLLLADLTLQLGNSPARRLELAGRRGGWCLSDDLVRSQIGRRGLAWPTATAQRFRTPCQQTIAPNLQILARKLQLARKRAHALARQHPADGPDFELSAENPG